jgi:5-methyltetrahydrofolate--homocysteine methyltransferase
VIIIGEKINASRKVIRQAIADRDEQIIKRAILAQDEAGAHYIDLNAGTGAGDTDQETADLEWLVDIALACTQKKLALDASDPRVLQRAAAHLDGRRPWLLNSISGEAAKLDTLVPLAAEHEVPVISLAMDDSGIPSDVDGRLMACDRILEAVAAAGIATERLYFDPLSMPISAGISHGQVTLETLRRIRERVPEAKTTVGLSNISFGLPRRSLINSTFLVAALSHGLDSAICDPTDPEVHKALVLGELVAGRDRHCRRYTREIRKGTLECAHPAAK